MNPIERRPISEWARRPRSYRRRRRAGRWARWGMLGALGAAVSGCAIEGEPATPREDRAVSAVESSAEATASTLSAAEEAGLQLMREEEKLARDVYLALHQRHEHVVFGRIAQSEQRHMDAVARLLDRYGLPDPAAGRPVGAFTSPELQRLYDELVERGSRSVAEALRVGALIEEIDIADLRRELAATDRADIANAYDNLLRGSRNHLRAFARSLAALGHSYEAEHLPAADMAAIIDGDHEPGPGRRGNRRGGGRGQGFGWGWR